MKQYAVAEFVDFFGEVCSLYHLGLQDKSSFAKWLALKANILFIRHGNEASELTHFCLELCERYDLGIPENEQDRFIEWAVCNSGRLYFKYALEQAGLDC